MVPLQIALQRHLVALGSLNARWNSAPPANSFCFAISRKVYFAVTAKADVILYTTWACSCDRDPFSIKCIGQICLISGKERLKSTQKYRSIKDTVRKKLECDKSQSAHENTEEVYCSFSSMHWCAWKIPANPGKERQHKHQTVVLVKKTFRPKSGLWKNYTSLTMKTLK